MTDAAAKKLYRGYTLEEMDRWGDAAVRALAAHIRELQSERDSFAALAIGTSLCKACAEKRDDHLKGIASGIGSWQRRAETAERQLAEARERAEKLTDTLSEACHTIDNYGFRSDDYGGTEDLKSCIKKLGDDRAILRKANAELRAAVSRLECELAKYK